MILNRDTIRASEAPEGLPHGLYLQESLLLSFVVDGHAYTLQMSSVEALQLGAALIHAGIEAARAEQEIGSPAGSA